MRKFGLIGFPLDHSFSQKYFSEKFRREKIADCTYENFPIRSVDEFPALLKKYPELCGINVTIPYKTEILRYANILDDVVDEIRAANVLKIKTESGKSYISAHNSDVYGIRDSIIPFAKGKGDRALVLGTGGSSKAVAWTLKKMGCEVTLVSRRKGSQAIVYEDITPEMIGNTRLIVNTTPLGMFPDNNSKPALDYNLLNKKHILFDLVYNPEITAFLKMGKERGCTIITGMKMLRSQADRAWEIWNEEDFQ